MLQPARNSRATSRNGTLNRRGTRVPAAEPTAASLARSCAGIISSNVKRLRRRAAVQPQRRRSHRQEDDRRTVEELGRIAGNSGVGRCDDRCRNHRSRGQLKQAGRKRADAHHAATDRRAAFQARVIGICAGITGVRHGTMIMTVSGMILMRRGVVLVHGMLGLRDNRRSVRQAMTRHDAVAECKSGDRHQNAKGIQRDENARRVDPCCSGQPVQHSKPVSNNGRTDGGRSVFEEYRQITTRARRAGNLMRHQGTSTRKINIANTSM